MTSSDVAKTWTSACTSATEVITGASNYQMNLTLNANNTFSYSEIWYTGTCSPANYAIIYNNAGTFAIVGFVSGSTVLQSLSFTLSSSDMMAFTTTVQTAVNNDCGGTSPYHSGASSLNNGVHESTYMISCMSHNFPNSGRNVVNNIASYSSGVLTVGGIYSGVPGIFSPGTVASTATVPLN